MMSLEFPGEAVANLTRNAECCRCSIGEEALGLCKAPQTASGPHQADSM